nr:vinorine synthase-like [Ipomoea batatas]
MVILQSSSSIPPPLNWKERYNKLRASLAETLNHVYQLAGRVGAKHSVMCNDQGVDLILAKVGQDMSNVTKHPRIETLRQLLPVKPETTLDEDGVIVAVQINTFACGGTAVGLCINHVIADGWSLAVFLNTWAGINRHDEKATKGFVLDSTSIFPECRGNGRDVSMLPLNLEAQAPKIESRRFVFNEDKVMGIKEKMGAIKGGNNSNILPSRIEAVSAFVWAALIKAHQETNINVKTHVMTSAINMRKRLKPPLPPQTIGNVFHGTTRSINTAKDGCSNLPGLFGRGNSDSSRAMARNRAHRFWDSIQPNRVATGESIRGVNLILDGRIGLQI